MPITAEVAEEYAREKPMRIRIPVEYDGPAPGRLKTTSESFCVARRGSNARTGITLDKVAADLTRP